ncbi:Imm5 family immunity protein [Actinomyces oris]|uniref:Imm5 family immunity protein n=1 Tax=Actinomyces oris TaxID=544580 RepID=UPI0032C0537B
MVILSTSPGCASAAAGALNWQPVEDTNVDARRAFWLWYLDEAIPAVLEAQ